MNTISISSISAGDLLTARNGFTRDTVTVRCTDGNSSIVTARHRKNGYEEAFHIGGLDPKVIDKDTLEGFGFRRTPDITSRNLRQWTADYGYGGIMRVTETRTGWKVEFIDGENCASVRTEHVHELQHLARIIAGVELTLNI